MYRKPLMSFEVWEQHYMIGILKDISIHQYTDASANRDMDIDMHTFPQVQCGD